LARGYSPLFLVFFRMVMSHDATANRSDYGMVARDVAGHSSDHRTFQTSRCVRCADSRK
jgi:hypothetical protein